MALEVRQDAPLDELNTFRVRARAHRLAVLEDAADIDAALDLLARSPRALVLGEGSNVLFTGDFDGTVLRMALRGRSLLGSSTEGGTFVDAAAGENWHAFVQWTLAQGLAGLENLSLIPGTVGASPIQNIGAYGVEMRDRFDSLLAVDRRDGRRMRLDAADCRFGYRDSVFKHDSGAHWLVLAVRFRLGGRMRPELDYGELRAEIARRRADDPGSAGVAARADTTASEPSAAEVAAAVCAIRRRKLPDPKQIGNAGSFFRNPVVSLAQAQDLAERFPELPQYPADPADAAAQREQRKLSAAWLIDQCGWKGARDGGAGVHERHALVLVNHGNAGGGELLRLAGRIAASVQERFGVALEPEPLVVQSEGLQWPMTGTPDAHRGTGADGASPAPRT